MDVLQAGESPPPPTAQKSKCKSNPWPLILLVLAIITVICLVIAIAVLGVKYNQLSTTVTNKSNCDKCPTCDASQNINCTLMTINQVTIGVYNPPSVQIVPNQVIVFNSIIANYSMTIIPASANCYFTVTNMLLNTNVTLTGMNFVDMQGNAITGTIVGGNTYLFQQTGSTQIQLLSNFSSAASPPS